MFFFAPGLKVVSGITLIFLRFPLKSSRAGRLGSLCPIPQILQNSHFGDNCWIISWASEAPLGPTHSPARFSVRKHTLTRAPKSKAGICTHLGSGEVSWVSETGDHIPPSLPQKPSGLVRLSSSRLAVAEPGDINAASMHLKGIRPQILGMHL